MRSASPATCPQPGSCRPCRHPAEWRWSSYRATAGLEAAPEFLTIAWLLDQLSHDRGDAHKRYSTFVEEAIRDIPPLEPLGELYLWHAEVRRRHTPTIAALDGEPIGAAARAETDAGSALLTGSDGDERADAARSRRGGSRAGKRRLRSRVAGDAPPPRVRGVYPGLGRTQAFKTEPQLSRRRTYEPCARRCCVPA